MNIKLTTENGGEFWMPKHDRTIAWNDPKIGVKWPLEKPVLSAKDQAGKALAEAEIYQ